MYFLLKFAKWSEHLVYFIFKKLNNFSNTLNLICIYQQNRLSLRHKL